MNIDLYQNNSDINVLTKNINFIATIAGELRGECTLINPSIIIEKNDINFNYIYIPDFQRYYYVRDIEFIRNNIMMIHLSVDVLMSFANQIKNNTGILLNTQYEGNDQYLSSENWVSQVKNKTDIINFPNGFNDNGEWILITAGGIQ